MIYSRASLLVASVASGDGVLGRVLMEADGTCVGTDGVALVVVSPFEVPAEKVIDLVHFNPPEGGITVEASVLLEVSRAIGRGKSGVGGALLTSVVEGGVSFSVPSRTGSRDFTGRQGRGRYPDWRLVLRRGMRKGAKGTAGVGKVCLPSAAVSKLFRLLSRWGEVSFTEMYASGLLVRALSLETGQRILCWVGGMETEGKWLDRDRWERALGGKGAKRLKRK